MYAIIQTGGKQYKVEPGEELRVEKLEGEIGDEVFFDKVLLVSKGGSLKVGKPFLKSAKVVARITGHGRGPKIVVYKYKKRKGYRKKQGHKQDFTGVKVINIEE